MRVFIDLELDGLEQALAKLLPAGVEPRSLSLDSRFMRLEAKAPLVGQVALIANVHTRPGSLVLSDFDLEGAGLTKALVLGKLRDKLSRVDRAYGAFRLWGDPDGERLNIRWTS